MPQLSNERKRLLIRLEEIIGAECYNASIQNWGPGGVFEGAGRSFRYPITFHDAIGRKLKLREVDESIKADMLRGGYYAFGANELHVMAALEEVLHYLEVHHGLSIE